MNWHQLSGISDVFVALQDYFYAGGWVLYGIFFVTVLMWIFIIERYWYFWRAYPATKQRALDEWQAREDTQSWFALRIRDRIISEVSVDTSQFITIIKTCIAVLPLLGLLGTVTGMIQVFDVLASLGASNPRAMASGITHATIPTMTGLAAAISGLFFSYQLERWAGSRTEEVADELRHF